MKAMKEKKLQEIGDLCAQGVISKAFSLRILSKILGNLSSAVQGVPYVQCHYQCLQQVYAGLFYTQQRPLESTFVSSEP